MDSVGASQRGESAPVADAGHSLKDRLLGGETVDPNDPKRRLEPATGPHHSKHWFQIITPRAKDLSICPFIDAQACFLCKDKM